MNINRMTKRLSSKEKVIKRKIHKYSKWSIYYPKSSWVNYLKVRIIEEQEQLDALYRAYNKNFNRRLKELENILTKEVSNERISHGLLRKWRIFKLKKLKEEYALLLEISQYK